MISAPSATRVCVVAEELGGASDEGGRNFARQLVEALGEIADVKAISVGGQGSDSVPASRTFLERGLKQRLRSFGPSLIIYLPPASFTLFSVLRCRVLRSNAPGARVAMVVHQRRHHSSLSKFLIRRTAPDVVFSQDRRLAAYAASLGCRAELLPPAVNLDRFTPTTHVERLRLRQQYGVDRDAFVLLHVGHLKQERGLDILRNLAAFASVVMVAGGSTGADREVHRQLEAAGVRVIRQQVPRIEELYQLADCYVFPVRAGDGAISMPLSVLEAMATDLPVVTTPFGALPATFRQGGGLHFAHDDDTIVAAIQDRSWMRGGSRELVAGHSWQRLAEQLLERATS